jgi:hypothetical protein
MEPDRSLLPPSIYHLVWYIILESHPQPRHPQNNIPDLLRLSQLRTMSTVDLARNPLDTCRLHHGSLRLVGNSAVVPRVDVRNPALDVVGIPACRRARARE